MKIRRLFALLLALLLMSAAVFPVQGVTPQNLLVLGDSISTGYGLPGDRTTCAGYANQLASLWGLEGDAYRNLSVNGDTAADLAALLPKINASVQAADAIVISIGGNDVLMPLMSLLPQLTGTSTLSQALKKIISSTREQVEQMFAEDAIRQVFDTALEEFRENFAFICRYLARLNRDARIVFLTQYNPLNGAGGFSALERFSDEVIGELNQNIKTLARATGWEVVDVYAAFAGHGGELTNIYLADIHPNRSGHTLICSLLADFFGAHPSAVTTAAVPETTAAPQTSAVPETTAVPQTTSSAGDSGTDTDTTGQQVPADVVLDGKWIPISVCVGIALICIAVGLLADRKARKK